MGVFRSCSTSPDRGFQPTLYGRVFGQIKPLQLTYRLKPCRRSCTERAPVTALCPGPVPTEWAEIASAERFSIPACFASTLPKPPSPDASGKRTVVPGIVPKFVSNLQRGFHRAACCCPRLDRQLAARRAQLLTVRARSACAERVLGLGNPAGQPRCMGVSWRTSRSAARCTPACSATSHCCVSRGGGLKRRTKTNQDFQCLVVTVDNRQHPI